MSEAQDGVLREIDFPQSSVGAPLPHVIADEDHLIIAYLVEVPNPDWDGRTIKLVGPATDDEVVAIVKVQRYLAFQFGPPNDEAIRGHRLFGLGLVPYSSFEVLNSSWLAALETANRVHRYHTAERYARYRHVVLTFHDSTLEFIGESWSVQLERGSVREALLAAATALD